jgi:predicted dehydrogenase
MHIAVCGLGFMGLTHLKAWTRLEGIKLAAVSSDDPKVLSGDLSQVQGNLGSGGASFDFTGAERYADALACVRQSSAEAVDLCLPTDLHAPVAIAALEAGKHVLVEKPMALDESECQRMIDAARASGRILMSAQVLRFFPVYRHLIDSVRSGSLGSIRHALFRRRCAAPAWGGWLWDKSKSGGGVFDLLIHDIDMMRVLFGPPLSVQAWGPEDLAGGLDLITAQFNYPDFAVTITGGWHHKRDYPFSMEFTVAGDQGVLEFSSAGRDLTLYANGGGITPVQLPDTDGYQAEIEYFLDCVRHHRPPGECSPESSQAAVALTRAASAARALKGTPVLCAH